MTPEDRLQRRIQHGDPGGRRCPNGTARPISEGALVSSRRKLDPDRTGCFNGDAVEPFQFHESSKAARQAGAIETYNIEISANKLDDPTRTPPLSRSTAQNCRTSMTAASFKRLGDFVHYGPEQLSFLSIPVQEGSF